LSTLLPIENGKPAGDFKVFVGGSSITKLEGNFNLLIKENEK
jgi:hypothetical protein